MSYSCSDFFDDIEAALGVEDPDDDGLGDNVSKIGDLCLAEIERLQKRDAQLFLLEDPNRSNADNIKLAAQLMRTARGHLRAAGAAKAAAYVQRALKSVEGAERHARGMAMRDIPEVGEQFFRD